MYILNISGEVRFQVLLPPGGSCRVFGSLICTKDFLKCSANRKNETEEECGRNCLLISNVGTSTCFQHRNKYHRCTVSWCVSRIPHPTHQIHLILFFKVNLLSHLPPGGRNILCLRPPVLWDVEGAAPYNYVLDFGSSSFHRVKPRISRPPIICITVMLS